MYLLTYEYETIVGTTAHRSRRFDSLEDFESFNHDSWRNVELFERRGNDWIRIRPEEG